MKKRVSIVGGGVIGVACAWYLTKAGFQCTIIDKGKIGGACSKGNCGLICPSHVLPLTEPGAFKEALKAMVTRKAPFSIRPRLDPHLWSWMWNFSRRCTKKKMLQAAAGIQSLLESSMAEYKRLIGEEQLDCEWQSRGLLFVYRDAKRLDSFDPTNRLLTEKFGESASRLNRDELLRLEPALGEEVAGGWYYENDAHLRPDKLIDAWRSRLIQQGCEFIEDSPVECIDGNAATVFTKDREYSSDIVLFATGAWSPKLAEMIGYRIPIEPGKGYSVTMPRPKVCPNIPLIFPEHRVAVTPMESGYRLGSIMEFAGWDESVDQNRLRLLFEGATPYLREPHCEPVLETWYGWRPMTYDSLPVIDWAPTSNKIIVATGHNMLGLSMATGTGRLVAELISDQQTHIDPAPYSISRF